MLPVVPLVHVGKRPTELFGKFTWRIENFTSVGSKRELRSAQFDVGEYKWCVCIHHSPHGQSACQQEQQSLNCCCCRAAAAAAVALGSCCVCCRYILVYPQGCDVCNHLSLFLCVADYDKLLPGTPQPLSSSQQQEQAQRLCASPTASQQQQQMQAAAAGFRGCDVVCSSSCRTLTLCLPPARRLEPLCTVHDRCCQQGPQEEQVLRYLKVPAAHPCSSSWLASGLSAHTGWGRSTPVPDSCVPPAPRMCADTLHRFCKKEHDWGWKKFMELSKVLDGFTVADTLVIKAQVQVIL